MSLTKRSFDPRQCPSTDVQFLLDYRDHGLGKYVPENWQSPLNTES